MKIIYTISLILFLMFTNNIHAAPVKDEISCMAKTIYWEARGEPYKGKLGIAGVVLNRVNNEKFPNSICEVVHQKKPLQFSRHITKGTPINTKDIASWKECLELAERIVRKQLTISSNFKALYFDQKSVRVPKRLRLHTIIGNHKFYI